MRSFLSRTSWAFLVGLFMCPGAAPAASAVESPAGLRGAATDPAPGMGAICLHERVVFRPKAVRPSDGGESEGRIELVRETVCADLSRSSCFEAGICR